MKFTKSLLTVIILTIFIAGCISPELRTARIAVNERDWDRALKAIDLELGRTGPTAEPLFLKGLIYEQKAQLAEKDSSASLLDLYTQMSAYYDSSLALSNLFADKINESRDRLFRKFLKRSADAADTSNWDASLANVDISITIAPDRRVLYQHAAVTAYNAERYDKAIGYALREVYKEHADSADITTREVLIASYSNKKDNANTLKWGKDLLSRCDPVADSAAYLRTHDLLLSVYEETNNHDAAIALIDEANKHFSNHSVMLMNKALFLIKKEDFQNAAKIYREVLAIDPENFDANLNLGTILVTDKMWKESIPYLKKAHETDGKNLVAIKNLMAAYYNTEQVKLGNEIRAKLDAIQAGK